MEITYKNGLNIDTLPDNFGELIAAIGNINLISGNVLLDESDYVFESKNGLSITDDNSQYIYFEYNGLFSARFKSEVNSVQDVIDFAKEYITLIQKLEDLTK